jgi:hypothetical protein
MGMVRIGSGEKNQDTSQITSISPVIPAVMGTTHPIARPNFRCRPDRVNGMPILREIRPLAADTPSARFHEKDNPGIPAFRLRAMASPLEIGGHPSNWKLPYVGADVLSLTYYTGNGNWNKIGYGHLRNWWSKIQNEGLCLADLCGRSIPPIGRAVRAEGCKARLSRMG